MADIKTKNSGSSGSPAKGNKKITYPKKPVPQKILLFENLISGFSAALIATPEENLENELTSWLKKFVEFLDVDRCVVNEIIDDGKSVRRLLYYTITDIDILPVPEGYLLPEGVIDELKKGLIIKAEKIPDDLPQSFRNGIIEKIKTKSVVIIPFSADNMVIGTLLFASFRKERKWSENLIRRIKLIAEIIANAIIRIRSHKALIELAEQRKQLEDTYSSVIKNANLGFMIIELSSHSIIDVNDEYCRMSGYSREELINKKTWEIDASMNPEKIDREKNIVIEKGSIHIFTEHRRKDGSIFNAEVSSTLFAKNNNIVYSFIRDISDLTQAWEDLEERLEFEELVSEFSATLIDIKPDNINKELNQWLRRLVTLLKLDRGVISEYLPDQNMIQILLHHTVTGEFITPLEEFYHIPDAWIKEYAKGETIKADKINDKLPSMILEWAQKDNIKSFVIVPLKIGDQILGNITLASHTNERVWSDNLIRRIRLIGEIIANAILRMRTQILLLKEVEHRENLEETYSSVIKNANLGFMIINLSGHFIIDVNDEYCRMSGYSREELINKKTWEIDASTDRDKVIKQGDFATEVGAIHIKTSHIRKDGSIFDVEVSSNHYAKDSNIVYSFIRDITEINNTQKELEERLEFEELIAEFSAALITPDDYNKELNNWLTKFVHFLRVDRGVVIEHKVDSRTVNVLIQYSVQEVDMAPLNPTYTIPVEEIEEFQKGLFLRAEKIPDDLPEMLRGGLIEQENTRSVIIVPLLAEGMAIGSLTFATYREEHKWSDDLVRRVKLIGEITANAILRKNSHEKLLKETEQRKRLEERYSSVVKNANVGFWITDIDQNILDTNDEYCRMSGYSREEILAMKVPEIDITFYTDDEKISKEILGTGAVHHEVIHKKKDGSFIDIAVSSTLIEKEGILYSFMRDITEEKKAKIEREERLAFEELVSELSASLMNIELSSLNEELKKWVVRFVDFLGIGRGVINEYLYDKNTIKCIVSYTDPSSDTLPHDTYLSAPDAVMNEFSKGATIRAEKIPDDLQPQFRGWIIEKHNTKSLVVVPLVAGNKVIGNLTFASYNKERKWSDDIFNRIKLIGEIIANAILRMRASEALNKAQTDLQERLKFEEIISEFSTALINIKPDDILSELEKWFVKFIDLMDADKCAVNEYSDDQQIIKNLIQYSIPEVDITIPAVRKTPEGEINELNKGIIKVEKIPEDLPQMFHGSFIEMSKAKSLIIIPLLTGNRIFGNLAITNYRKERNWSDELIRRIKLIGEIVGNAVLRMRTHEALVSEMERRHLLEERYSSIIKTANVGFMISDMDANILEVNDAYCEMSGYRRDELLTMKITHLDISADPERIERDKDTMLKTGAFHHETGHIRKDGKIINVLLSANLLPHEGIICGFIRDVTELKIAREDLEERLEFEKLTSEFSAVLINLNLDIIDKELNPWVQKYVEFLEVERGIINEYDYKNSSVNVIASYTAPYIDVPPTDKSNEAPPLIMEKLAKGDVIRAAKIPEDLPAIFNDSIIRRHRTKSILIVPLSAENKTIGNLTFATYTKEHEWSDEFVRRIRLIGEIIANAILRKRASDTLIEEIKSRYMLEEKYTSIIKNASVGFIISDQNHNILSVNDEYCRMSGYTHDELIKMKITDIDYSINSDKIDNDRILTVESGLYHHHTRHIRKDGSIFDVEVNSQFSLSEGFIFSFIRDVTDLNNARRDLEDKLRFETLTTGFSATLIKMDLNIINIQLNQWLKKFVEFLDVDRGIVYEYQDDGKTFKSLINYTNTNIAINPPEELLSLPDRIITELKSGNIIRAEKIPDDLPIVFRGWVIEEHNTRSLVIVPLKAGNQILGNLTFATYQREHEWSDETVGRINLIGEIIANAISRRRSSDALITEMQRRQQLEERYTSIIKTANVGFWISDTNQNILVVNDEYCRMSGYSRDDLLTMKIADIDASKDHEQIEKDGADSISKGSSHRERKHIRKDGTIFDVEISTNYLSGEGLFFCFTRDITELNQAKKELVERLSFEELVSEFSAALINVKINNNKPELDNWIRRFSELLNVDRWRIGQYEENYGIYRIICSYINPHLDPKPPDNPMVMINDKKLNLDKYLIKGEILKLDSINDKFPEDLNLWQQLVRNDGTKSILMLPLMVGETLLGRMVIATFVHEKIWTDEIIRRLKLVAEIFANSLMREKKDSELDNYRKHLENMVEERTARLEETQKELVINEKMATLGKLTATVSHELRNPLGTIRTSVFSIGKRMKGQDDKVMAALDRAERNIRRCDLIIDELLNYSRVQALIFQSTNLDIWIREVVDETKPPSGISVKTELNAGVTIGLDQERFRRCMVNILTNAYQAIEEKVSDEPGNVIISTHKEKDKIILDISDNGVGFDMAIKNRLFEPLFSTKAFGVGLGIPITRQIIEQHGFQMDMKGEPMNGASVIITIPMIDMNYKNN